jgi:2,5-furandicarboxylate decarboxylase 1
VNIIDKTEPGAGATATDCERFRLRRFIEALDAEALQVRKEPIDLAEVAEVLDGNPRAVMFRAVGPERHELVGNVTGSRARIAQAFGVAPHELLSEVQRRLRNRPEIIELTRAEAPAQEVVLTGADADLTTLPVHLQHGADGAPYISASTDFVVDPKTGWTNIGVRRLMLASISIHRATCAPSTRQARRPAGRSL